MSVIAPTRPDLEGIADDARRLAPLGSYAEVMQGVRFVIAPSTPRLDRVVASTVATLRDAFRRAASPASVERATPLLAGDDTVVVPDVVVRDDGSRHRDVRLVVSVRAESTDRYALGPKRLAYQTAGIDEYWFLDPHNERLVVMILDRRTGIYCWPAPAYGPRDAVAIGPFRPATVTVADLLGVGPRRPARVERGS